MPGSQEVLGVVVGWVDHLPPSVILSPCTAACRCTTLQPHKLCTQHPAKPCLAPWAVPPLRPLGTPKELPVQHAAFHLIIFPSFYLFHYICICLKGRETKRQRQREMFQLIICFLEYPQRLSLGHAAEQRRKSSWVSRVGGRDPGASVALCCRQVPEQEAGSELSL